VLALLAIVPILVVFVGLGVLKKPAIIVAPLGMIVTIIIAIASFGLPAVKAWHIFYENGVVEGLKVFFMIFGAFTLLRFMQNTGAIVKIQGVVSDLTKDKRAHVIIIAIFLGTFFEGAAGAGTPAAVCAPLLIGLGYAPITAAVVCLIANCVPVSWGAAGITTILATTITDVKNYMSVAQASAAAGKMHMIGALIILFVAIWVVFGKKGFKGLFPYLALNSILYCVLIFAFSHNVPEIVGIATGMIMVAFNILLFKVFKLKIKTPEEFLYTPDVSKIKKVDMHPIMAFLPYILLCILIPVVRFSFPVATLVKIGFTLWIGCVIFFVIILSALIVKGGKKALWPSISSSFKSVVPSGIALLSMVTLAQIMNGSGMTMEIAKYLSNVGNLYPALAVIIGVLGAFVSGTAATSNIMFGGMHCAAATTLGLNPIPVFGAQNAGGALGNMICPHNIVAVTTTTGLRGQEGLVMRRALQGFIVVLILYMALALLYTLVIMPNYPGIVGHV